MYKKVGNLWLKCIKCWELKFEMYQKCWELNSSISDLTVGSSNEAAFIGSRQASTQCYKTFLSVIVRDTK